MQATVICRLGLWQNVESEKFVEQYRAFDRWTNEHIPFPGEAFRQTVHDLVQENKLIKGEMTLDGEPVLLEEITQFFLAIAAEGTISSPSRPPWWPSPPAPLPILGEGSLMEPTPL